MHGHHGCRTFGLVFRLGSNLWHDVRLGQSLSEVRLHEDLSVVQFALCFRVSMVPDSTFLESASGGSHRGVPTRGVRELAHC